jgi:hypothetical protein
VQTDGAGPGQFAALVEPLRACLATRHPNIVRCLRACELTNHHASADENELRAQSG